MRSLDVLALAFLLAIAVGNPRSPALVTPLSIAARYAHTMLAVGEVLRVAAVD